MDIMTIIAKAADGQTLTDDERTALKGYKPTDVKAYEAELADLRAKLALAAGDKDKGATEVAQLRKQVESLTKGLEEERAARKQAAEEAKAVRRAQSIDTLRAKHHIAFIDGVDPALTRSAFERAFADVDDLEDEGKVKTAVEAFRKANAGLIKAPAGGPGIPLGGAPTPDGGAPVSSDEMAATLAKAGIIKPSTGAK